MILCPICQSKTKVLKIEGVRRRRKCLENNHRFNTDELPEHEPINAGMVLISEREHKAFLAIMKIAKLNLHLMVGK
jgi:transcriptional regulator NrdR family protein